MAQTVQTTHLARATLTNIRGSNDQHFDPFLIVPRALVAFGLGIRRAIKRFTSR